MNDIDYHTNQLNENLTIATEARDAAYTMLDAKLSPVARDTLMEHSHWRSHKADRHYRALRMLGAA